MEKEKEKEGDSSAYKNDLLKLYMRCRSDDEEAYCELKRLVEAPSSSHPTPEDALAAKGYLGDLLLIGKSQVIDYDEKRGNALLSELSYLDKESLTCCHLQYLLGAYYHDCLVGMEEEAFLLYQKGADQGHILAISLLAYCYGTGEGTQKDVKKSLSLYKKAADLGHPVAQFNIGWMYFGGNYCVEKDKTIAFKWFKKSAENGYREGIFRLGECYRFGDGVEENMNEAVKSFSVAAERGFALAQYRLGYCYHRGFGIVRNDEKAIEWMKCALKGGIVSAASYLGEAYELGIGVEINIVEAVRYYRKTILLNEQSTTLNHVEAVSHATQKLLALEEAYQELVVVYYNQS